ncbi:hypothetical protein [Actinomadura bangladeshensis]|uniref:Plasmid mobilization relaxosome protein MobC n=1 Tax=Actinomadura bangladeshensis TaxID=453573 RepID=A0A4R4NZ02_9ACTN|nr:hypothetical protein [Actinomadura bangladeshensis]TDC13483.1 hypothetical protein E1284_20070 [Actinomadura bangladeshensis]
MRFSLSDEEHALVASAAAEERLALGAYAAQTVLTAARGSVQPQYGLLREALKAVMHAAGQARRIGVNLNQAVAAVHSGELPPELRWYMDTAARTVRHLDDLAEEIRRHLP